MISFLPHQASKLIVLFVIVLLSYSGSVLAQPTEIQELKLMVESLKKEVEMLKITVVELKAAKPIMSSKLIQAPKLPNVKRKKVTGNPWHSLKVNITKAEVTTLLGNPGKIHKWRTGEAWYFPNPKGGEVDFNSSEIVTGWLEP